MDTINNNGMCCYIYMCVCVCVCVVYNNNKQVGKAIVSLLLVRREYDEQERHENNQIYWIAWLKGEESKTVPM